MKNTENQPSAPPITLGGRNVIKCPFRAYEALGEHPAYQDPVSGNFILTHYAHIRKAVLNNKALSNKTGLIATRESSVKDEANRPYRENGWVPVDTLVTNDQPSHRTFRALVDKAFIPEKVALVEPRIDAIVTQLIDAFIDQGEVDFVKEVAVKLPILLFNELLGITECDIDLFKHWSDTSIEKSSDAQQIQRVVHPHSHAERDHRQVGDLAFV